MAFTELLIVLAAALPVGWLVTSLLGLNCRERIYRGVFALAIGLGIFSYLILCVGLLGGVSSLSLTISLFALTIIAFTILLIRRLKSASKSGTISRTEYPRSITAKAYKWASVILLAFIGCLVVFYCFVPPGAHEWDALSYHLADPKIWIIDHRIVFLPTDSHSDFPFLMEMLYMLGLLWNGYALANLFHFVFAALCVVALLNIGERHFGSTAGFLAALVLVTSPLAIWEASCAYIEMGMALYALLATAACLEYWKSSHESWLYIAGVCMGLGLGVKDLSLIPAFILLLLMIVRKAPWRPLTTAVILGVLFGCPFYVKSTVMTGNPVYPFAYSIFGGKYWNAELAHTYSTEQRSFGESGETDTVAQDVNLTRPPYKAPNIFERLRSWIDAPFKLISIPHIYYNYNDPGIFTQLGFLFLSLAPLIFLAPEISFAAKTCLVLAGGWFLGWAISMQYVRYILPMLPVIGLIGGEGAALTVRRWNAVKYLMIFTIILQTGLSLSYYIPKILSDGRLPGMWAVVTNDEARSTYLRGNVNSYRSDRWINRNTPRNAGVILYEETRGYYLNRRYLWGNQGHSLYIPYSSFRNGHQMVKWFVDHGYQYALLNLQFAPQSQSPDGMHDLAKAVQTGSEGQLLLQWYYPGESGERWRGFLGEAYRDGEAILIPAASADATVVFQFKPTNGHGL